MTCQGIIVGVALALSCTTVISQEEEIGELVDALIATERALLDQTLDSPMFPEMANEIRGYTRKLGALTHSKPEYAPILRKELTRASENSEKSLGNMPFDAVASALFRCDVRTYLAATEAFSRDVPKYEKELTDLFGRIAAFRALEGARLMPEELELHADRLAHETFLVALKEREYRLATMILRALLGNISLAPSFIHKEGELPIAARVPEEASHLVPTLRRAIRQEMVRMTKDLSLPVYDLEQLMRMLAEIDPDYRDEYFFHISCWAHPSRRRVGESAARGFKQWLEAVGLPVLPSAPEEFSSDVYMRWELNGNLGSTETRTFTRSLPRRGSDENDAQDNHLKPR